MISCDPESPSPTPSSTPEKRINNVTYGAHARHIMDIRLAADRTPSDPFVIMIHGGSWNSGDKSDLNEIADSLLKRGISSASINYRYASSSIHYEELMSDVHQALLTIISHSDDWLIRNTDYGIMGYSAGAHMALLYSYKYDEGHHIKCVISAAGPTDIADVDFLNYSTLIGLLPQIQNMVGATYTFGSAVPERFFLSSPAHYPGDNSTLLIHGSDDLVVAEEHSNRLKRILSDRGTVHDILIISGANHDLGFANPGIKSTILSKIANWLNTYK